MLARSPLYTLLAMLGAVALLFGGCADDDSDTPNRATASLKFAATTGTVAPAAAPPLALLSSGVDLTDFALNVREIELEADSEAETEFEAEFPGPFLVDLLAGAPISLGSATIQPGSYEELEFDLARATGVDPTGATDLAAYMAGSYTTASAPCDAGCNFVVTLDVVPGAEFDLELSGPNPIVIDGATNELLVQVPLADLFTVAWLETLRQNPAAGGTDTDWRLDVVFDQPDEDSYLSGSPQREVHDHFEQVLDFGEDRNGDDSLDDDEDVDDDSP